MSHIDHRYRWQFYNTNSTCLSFVPSPLAVTLVLELTKLSALATMFAWGVDGMTRWYPWEAKGKGANRENQRRDY